MLDIRLYRNSTGREPFAEWLDGLDHHAAAKVTTAIRRLESGSLAEVKSVGGGVLERRINWGPGYRVYFARVGQAVILLLGGGTKKLQQRDIEDAQARWIDHKRRARQ